jgi:hypothetical protein
MFFVAVAVSLLFLVLFFFIDRPCYVKMKRQIKRSSERSDLKRKFIAATVFYIMVAAALWIYVFSTSVVRL